jgi:Exostosin family
MALIYLTTTAESSDWNPYALANFDRILKSSKCSIARRHALTTSPTEADIILFVGSKCIYHSDIINSKLYHKYPHKSLIFDLQDVTIPHLPGLYTNIPSYLHQYPIYEYGFYPRIFDNELLEDRADFSECKYLFSFVGNTKTYPQLRRKIVKLSHPQAYLKDSVSENTKIEQTYTDILKVSKFVLCPRGIAASTFRLFETMRSARVPVIIADDWMPPIGIDWNEFSVRVPENDLNSIPDRLERLEANAQAMGQRAFACWQANFATDTSFDWIAAAAVRIQSVRSQYQQVIDRNLYHESLDRDHFNNFWKEWLRVKLGKV